MNDLITKPKKWVITGAAGFIGSHLCEYLIKADQQVTCIDNFATGKKENYEYLESLSKEYGRNNISFLDLDISDSKNLEKAISGHDVILHQAAISSVPRSLENPEETHHNNVTGFLSLLEAARKNSIKRIVYATSATIYGNNTNLPLKETEPAQVLTPYGASKKIMEVYSETYKNAYQMELIGLRYFNIFGPRQSATGAYANVIPKWASEFVNNQQPRIFGDGTTTRDFCYIDDVVAANIKAAVTENNESFGQVFNIARGKETSLNELFSTMLEIFKEQKDDFNISEAKYEDFRQGDIKHSLADVSKTKNLLNHESTADFKESVAKTVEYFLNK